MAGMKRESVLAEKSLICLLQGCQGHKVTVEMRNESFAKGTVVLVDGFMNVTMKDVELTDSLSNNTVHLEELFIQGRQIRFVQIPDEINMRDAIETQLKTLSKAKVPPARKQRRFSKS